MAEIKYSGTNTLAALVAAIKDIFVAKSDAVSSVNGKRGDVTIDIPSQQIINIETDAERLALSSPVADSYYFVAETSSLWAYRSGTWVQITMTPAATMSYIDETILGGAW